MQDREGDTLDDGLEAIVIAYHDALPGGTEAIAQVEAQVPPERWAAFLKWRDCLHFLETAIPRRSGTTAGMSADDNMLPVVPNYDVGREIGRGGMGVVYEARDKRLPRSVALKIPYACHTARFLQEARAIARLQHPNIIKIFEVGEYNGLPFLALEFHEAGGLHEKLGSGPWQPQQAASLVEKLARALQYAHEQGIVHRDMKPANVLLRNDGEPIITDLGLAKVLGQPPHTSAGTVLGTLDYMAPEQADSDRGQIGPATDIYALGAILYELVTGRRPFDGGTKEEKLRQVLFDEPLPPSRHVRHLPRPIEIICLKCLEKTPKRRYLSAAELGDDLRRFLKEEPIVAKRASFLTRICRRLRRNPGVSVGGVALALAGIVLVVAASPWNWTDVYTDDPRETSGVKSVPSGAQPRNDSKRGEPKHARQEVPPDTAKAASKHASADVVSKVKPANNSAIRVLRGHDGRVWRVAFSPDGKHLLSGSNSHFIRNEGGNGVNFPGNDNTVRLWEAETGRPLAILRGHLWEIMALAFCPKDGALGAACSSTEWATDFGDPTLTVYNLKAAEVRHRFTLPPRPAMRGIALSADGKKVFICRGDHSLHAWDLATRMEQPTTTLEIWGGENGLWAVDFTADRTRVIGGMRNGRVCLWETATGKLIHQYVGHLARVQTAVFSPDEKRIATSSDDGTVRVWDLATQKELLCLTGEGIGGPDFQDRPAIGAVFSPNGRWILSGGLDGTVRLWDSKTGDELQRYVGHTKWVRAVAVSPDGRLAASGSDDKTIRIWQLPK